MDSADIVSLRTYQEDNSNLKIVFHFLCSNGSCKEKSIIKFIKLTIDSLIQTLIKNKNENPKEVVKAMLNQKTVDHGRTPLFVAAYNNKKVLFIQEIVKLLIEHGANINTTDNDNYSLLHISALFNYLPLLAFLIFDLNMDINVVDKDLRTPLHVSAFEGKEQSCTLLIALTTNFEIKDKDGFTPLQLASFSNNYRIIRHLIMRGASREQKSPEFTAETIGKIMEAMPEVFELLKQPTCLQRINPVKPALVEAKNSPWTFLFNIGMFLIRYTIIVVLIYPFCQFIPAIISASFGALGLILLLTVSCKNPGYQKQGGNLEELYSTYKEEFICAYCQIKKEISMKHCQQCNRCVHKFDHHCPYIRNCVGKQ